MLWKCIRISKQDDKLTKCICLHRWKDFHHSHFIIFSHHCFSLVLFLLRFRLLYLFCAFGSYVDISCCALQMYQNEYIYLTQWYECVHFSQYIYVQGICEIFVFCLLPISSDSQAASQFNAICPVCRWYTRTAFALCVLYTFNCICSSIVRREEQEKQKWKKCVL